MKILLISYYFPPYNSVGAVRTGKFAKFLLDQGHTVKVVTAESPAFPLGIDLEIPVNVVHPVKGWSVNAPIQWLLGGRQRVAQEGYRNSRLGRLAWLGRLYKTMFHWPDAEVGWIGAAISEGRALLRREAFDFIYASAPPFSGLFVAEHLSKEFGVPWIAEFRDLWTQNHAYEFPLWRQRLDRVLERRALSSASLLVTVSKELAEDLKRFDKPVFVVRNGYDPIDIKFDLEPTSNDIVNQGEEITLAYTGNIYPEYNDVDLLCRGILAYISIGGKIKIAVVGRNISRLMDSARHYGIFESFQFLSVVERKLALQIQRYSDGLILFSWTGASSGILPVKFFEYVSARRPILAVGPKSVDLSELVVSDGFGAAAASVDDIVSYLITLAETKRNFGTTELSNSISETYTRAYQFKNLENEMLALHNTLSNTRV